MIVNATKLSPHHIQDNGLFFIFGADEGLISRAKYAILRAHDPLLENVSYYGFRAAKDNASKILAEVSSPTLFGGEKSAVIDEISGNFSTKFFDSFTAKPGVKVLFIAGEVRKKSKLYTYFSGRTDVCVVQCYPLEYQDVVQLISNLVQKDGKKIEARETQLLATFLPRNVSIIEQELGKLVSFVGQKPVISETDILALFTNDSDILLDDVIEKIILRDQKAWEITERFFIANDDGIEPAILLLRSLLNALHRLLQVHVAVKNGKSEAMAVQALVPPVFYKRAEAFTRMLRATSAARVKQMMSKAIQLEKQCKLSGASSLQIICASYL